MSYGSIVANQENSNTLGYRDHAIVTSLLEILTIVHGRQAVSRSELSECTGLSRSAISQRVSQLIDSGLLVEGSAGGFTGGRRSRLLRLNSHYGQLIGVDLGATGVQIGLFDLPGKFITSITHTA